MPNRDPIKKTANKKTSQKKLDYNTQYNKDHPEMRKKIQLKYNHSLKGRKYHRLWVEVNKQAWRQLLKSRKLDYCSQCGYSKCFAAIEFHHIDPSKKDIEMCKILPYKITKKRIEELMKCQALCSNCHRELHDKERNNVST